MQGLKTSPPFLPAVRLTDSFSMQSSARLLSNSRAHWKLLPAIFLPVVRGREGGAEEAAVTLTLMCDSLLNARLITKHNHGRIPLHCCAGQTVPERRHGGSWHK